jgi:hypothetical protein
MVFCQVGFTSQRINAKAIIFWILLSLRFDLKVFGLQLLWWLPWQKILVRIIYKEQWNVWMEVGGRGQTVFGIIQWKRLLKAPPSWCVVDVNVQLEQLSVCRHSMDGQWSLFDDSWVANQSLSGVPDGIGHLSLQCSLVVLAHPQKSSPSSVLNVWRTEMCSEGTPLCLDVWLACMCICHCVHFKCV